MAMRILTQEGDMDLVRQVAIAAEIPALAAQDITDATIQSDPIGGRAEADVIAYLVDPATDLPLILSGTAPSAYANGDATSALTYIRSAAVYLVCVYCVPMLAQLVPAREDRGDDRIQRDLTWSTIRATWLAQAQGSLNSLVPITFPSGLKKIPPVLPATDPLSTLNTSYGFWWRFGLSRPESPR
jgi:hypothetical protein